MSANRKPWTEQDHNEATSKADAASMRVYGLASMLKVCAFAAEARRTLTEIEDRLTWRDKVREDLRVHINHMTNWQEMPDASSEALQYIAQELAQANEEFANLSYRLANRLRDGSDHGDVAQAA